MPTLIPPWPENIISGVAEVLGETTTGLTGTEIGQLLRQVRAPDIHPDITKRHRLRDALAAKQATIGGANSITAFIAAAMDPVRFRSEPERFSFLQGQLNEVLVFIGHRVNDQGKVAKGPAAATLSEAARHANSLRQELRRRGTHAEVLKYCSQEILEKNTFHAQLEAAKGLADRLRTMTGETADGAALIDRVLAFGASGKPRVAINSLATPTDEDEQKGFASLCKGLFSMYRNPRAHGPRIGRTTSDDELLEMLTIVSMAHRRLDSATVTP
jgi:uncharacterized protein (TIGR02391 family)